MICGKKPDKKIFDIWRKHKIQIIGIPEIRNKLEIVKVKRYYRNGQLKSEKVYGETIPFKEKEIHLPAIDTLDFSRRSWAEPIWQEYMNLCEEITTNSYSDQFRTGFYEFFGGPDYELINKIEEVLLEERAFPKQSQQNRATLPKTCCPLTIL